MPITKALKLEPTSREAREKHNQAKAAVRKARFEEAIAVEVKSAFSFDIDGMGTH